MHRNVGRRLTFLRPSIMIEKACKERVPNCRDKKVTTKTEAGSSKDIGGMNGEPSLCV